MNKYFSLTRVLFKNAAGMVADGKTKKYKVYLLYGIIGVCFIPTLFLFYLMFDGALETFTKIHQEGAVLALGFFAANIITFIFSIFLIPSVFYFSKDSETLLSLPIKPQTILGAKFTVCLMYEYLFTFAVCIPILAAYMNNIAVEPLFYVFIVIILLLLPIFPLVLSSLISMLVMRFVPFFKNRDRFNMIGGLLAVVLAMSFSFFMNSSSMQNSDPSEMLNLLISGDNSLISMFSFFFPNVRFAAEAVVNYDFLQVLLYIGVVLLSLVVFVIVGKYFYFKGAIGFNETGSHRKAISDKDMKKATKGRSKITSYMWKEWNLLLRTPAYFLNCISTVFIFPLMFGIIYFTGGSSNASSGIDLSMLGTIDYNEFLPYVLLAGFAFGFFFANINMVSSTSISREGTNLMFMKYIPMSLGKQIIAKVSIGIILAIVAMLIAVIFIAFLLPDIPIIMYIALCIPAIITIIFGNFIGVMIDMAHPKLIWEQEAAAVKQNMSGMLAMFGGWLIIVPLGFLIFKLPYDSLYIAFTVISIVMIGTVVILYMKMEKIAQHFFKKL